MKKKLFPFFIAAIVGEIVGIALVILLLVFTSPGQTIVNNVTNTIKSTTGLSDNEFLQQRLSQDFDIVADVYIYNTSKIRVCETIFFTNSNKKPFIYIPFANNANYSISKLLVDDINSTYSINGTCIFPKINSLVKKIYIEYQVDLANSKGILSLNNGNYYLGGLFAVKGVYSGSNPIITYKSQFGDPYLYDAASYNICVYGDKDLKIFAPEVKNSLPSGSKCLVNFETSKVRDFPMVISKNLSIVNTYYKGIRVNYIGSSKSRVYVEKSLDYMENLIGIYPYKVLYIVSVPLSQSGMEFSGMIFLSDELFKTSKDLDVITYHEMVHQWFYGIVGTDQWNEPFLDEGIADYLAVYIKGGQNSLPKNPADPYFYTRKLSDFKSKDDYYSSAYKSSATYFKNLHQNLGNGLFEMLKKIYNDKQFSYLYYKDLQNYIKAIKK